MTLFVPWDKLLVVYLGMPMKKGKKNLPKQASDLDDYLDEKLKKKYYKELSKHNLERPMESPKALPEGTIIIMSNVDGDITTQILNLKMKQREVARNKKHADRHKKQSRRP